MTNRLLTVDQLDEESVIGGTVELAAREERMVQGLSGRAIGHFPTVASGPGWPCR